MTQGEKNAKQRVYREKRKVALAKAIEGRPPKYSSAAALRQAVDNYFVECEKKSEFPCVAGLQCSIGVYSNSLFDEMAIRGAEYSEIARECKSRMFNWKFQSASSGEMDKTIFIFDSINNHGMINTRSENKTESKIEANLNVNVPPELADMIDE